MIEDTELEQLRYPNGRFEFPAEIDAADREAYLDRIEATPGRLRALREREGW